jgi:DSF synthase
MNVAGTIRGATPTTARQYAQLETQFEPEAGVYWAIMNPQPRPSFGAQLLLDLKSFISGIIDSHGQIIHAGRPHAINYAVLASNVPGVFNLGGDLSLFRDAILKQDRVQLEKYAEMCVDDLFPWNRNFNLPITTISLVQGTALGGGFEAALASSVVVAEESCKMGFPEVLFNLFPGMGAYSFLQRKVGRRTTEELILSGNTYSARQLYDMGIVDIITADGTGQAAVANYVRKHGRGSNGRRAFERVRRDFEAVTREELLHITGVWVEAAMRLSERDLRMMDRLIRAQERGGITPLTSAVHAQPRLNVVGAAD